MDTQPYWNDPCLTTGTIIISLAAATRELRLPHGRFLAVIYADSSLRRLRGEGGGCEGTGTSLRSSRGRVGNVNQTDCAAHSRGTLSEEYVEHYKCGQIEMLERHLSPYLWAAKAG